LNCTLRSLFAFKKTEELSCSDSSQPVLSCLEPAAVSKNFEYRLSQNTNFGGSHEETECILSSDIKPNEIVLVEIGTKITALETTF